MPKTRRTLRIEPPHGGAFLTEYTCMPGYDARSARALLVKWMRGFHGIQGRTSRVVTPPRRFVVAHGLTHWAVGSCTMHYKFPVLSTLQDFTE